jgi:hypothetical protein
MSLHDTSDHAISRRNVLTGSAALIAAGVSEVR